MRFFAILLLICSRAFASDLQIEMAPYFDHQPLVLGAGVDFNGEQIAITRADWFISGLALQKADGTWLDSHPGWAANFRSDGPTTGSLTNGVPAEKFQSIRFRIGLSKAQNDSDPNTHEPDSALHPDICRMHWGWQGGYVLVAIEGHRAAKEGFSYHLANNFDTSVEIPVTFDGTSPTTIRLALHIDKILGDLDFTKDGTSTHSRDNDPLGARLFKNTAGAVTFLTTSDDIFQHPPAIEGSTYNLAATSRFPKVTLPADNPLTPEGIELGRQLFNDPRLSKNNSQSCAACHLQKHAFADPRKFSIGADGTPGTRNAMPLFNLAWAGSTGYHWDASVKTLREQVRRPITSAHEMNETFDNILPKLAGDYPGLTEQKLTLSLEQFLLSLVSQNSKFDRAVRKLDTLTPDEQRGLQLFITEHDPKRNLFGADCFHCHGGTLFTDHRLTNNGTSPSEKFKTPSLRNIALTAPYMHDGRFASLEEVIQHYNNPIPRSDALDPNIAKHPPGGLGLSAEDQAALIAFLKTLTDTDFTDQ